MTARFTPLVLLLAALSACVPYRPREEVPRRPPAPATRPAEGPLTPAPRRYRSDVNYARSAEEVSGPAVLSLLDHARDALAAGRPEQAVATLETALDIEKRNPFVWQQLAQAHLARGQPEDAEIVAHRSNSFANGNPYIETGNWRVIERARAARGDAAGVAQARERLAELEALIED
jgi:tetratricopeptide (TPR) repeat protein